MKNLERIGEQLIPTIAIGDAVGLPFETAKPKPAGSITGLEDIDTFLGKHPAGTWSDDTHLSIATALSLIESSGFSLEGQAVAHVKALQHVEGDTTDADWIPPVVTTDGSTGWGGTTTNAVRRLLSGANPKESGEPNGAGNGVLMKMAPLVYWQSVRGIGREQAEHEVTEFTCMTHAAPEAIVSSLVHRRVLSLLLEPRIGPAEFPRIYRHAIKFARQYEQGRDRVTSDTLRRLERFVLPGDPNYPPLAPEHIVDAAPIHGFYAPETLLMAYGNFLLENTYPNCTYRAAELGGDTDSIASITATMSLFAHGEVQQPADYDKLYDHPRLERISKNLAQAALKGV